MKMKSHPQKKFVIPLPKFAKFREQTDTVSGFLLISSIWPGMTAGYPISQKTGYPAKKAACAQKLLCKEKR